MVQVVTPETISGKIGRGFGQGLAEQIPKEIERARLSSGLRQLEQESQNLTPLQQMTRIAAIPGITPQMIQSFGELAKQQNVRNAYMRGRTSERQGLRETPEQQMLEEQARPSQQLKDLRFANLPEKRQQAISPEKEIAGQYEQGLPQAVETNPLRAAAIPKTPWSPQRRNEEIGRIFEDFPNLTLQEAQAMAADNEARELSQPKVQQEIDTYLNAQREDISKKFTEQLQNKLQKTGSQVYGDITGEMQEKLKKSIERDLKLNPNANVRDVVDKWTTKALDLSKTKKDLQAISKRGFFDIINPLKKSETFEEIKQAQRIFAESKNEEEFFNILRGDFGLSSQAAAFIAYPPNKKLKEFLSKIKISPRTTPSHKDFAIKNTQIAQKIALEAENYITPNDSLLGLAYRLRRKDPYFDQRAFFKQLREDQESLPLSEVQKRELLKGVGDIFPNWADIWTIPGGKND